MAALRAVCGADTLSALFQVRVATHSSQPFLRYRERTKTWSQVDAEATAWARHMRHKGYQAGDRVAVVLPNCDSQIILLLACAAAGLVFVPVNHALTALEIEAVLGVVQPTLVVVTEAESGKVTRASGSLNQNPDLLKIDAATLALPPLSLADGAAAGVLPEPSPDDPLTIVFTSGTTGTPKGAIHSNRTYVLAANIAAFRMRLTGDDRMLVVLPLFHLNALFYSVGGAIVSGAPLAIEERFSASSFWHTVNRFGITQVNMIAAVGNILLKRNRTEFPGPVTLRKVSAAPVTAAVAEALREAFGIAHTVESYGMTEAPGIAQVDFGDQDHRACLGKPITHPLTNEPISEIRIVTDDRQEVPAGEIGRIMIRAKTMMKGYFNRPDLDHTVDGSGWFLTEDLGRVDADGYFYFCGRTSEIIRSRGENVAASEIEGVLLAHSGIVDAGCIGVPSDLGEEDIVAFVAPLPGANLDLRDVARFCRDRLGAHKVPRYFVVRTTLPKTPTEKVARHRLKELPDLLVSAISIDQLEAKKDHERGNA